MKIGAQNKLKGLVQSINNEGILAKIKIKIQIPVVLTSIISKNNLEELGAKAGDEIKAVIKATEVFLSKDE